MFRAVAVWRAAVRGIDDAGAPSHGSGGRRLVPGKCTVGTRGARLLQEFGDDGFGPRRAGLREGPDADLALVSCLPPRSTDACRCRTLAEWSEGVATRAASTELVAECFAAAPEVTFIKAARRLGGSDGDEAEESHFVNTARRAALARVARHWPLADRNADLRCSLGTCRCGILLGPMTRKHNTMTKKHTTKK